MTNKEITLFFAQNLLTMEEDPRAFEKLKNREKRKRWYQSPKGQAYEFSPKMVALRAAYQQLPEVKEAKRARARTPEARAVKKEYEKSPRGRRTASENGKKHRAQMTNLAIRRLLSRRSWEALKLQDTSKSEATMKLHGCTVAEFKAHIEKQFEPWMNWSNYGTDPEYNWQLDHIRPCASFDLTDPGQQKECFHFTNYRPLRARDNFKKGARWSPVVGGTVVSRVA